MSGSVVALLSHELHVWSPQAYLADTWAWPDGVIAPLSEALVPKRVPFDRKSGPALPLLTIRFDGTIEDRGETTDDVQGPVFVVEAGDVVYSKIDVRNGAIGLVPTELARACVTAEYPAYRMTDRCDAIYIQLLFRTKHFRRTIRSMVSGASGRKRVNPEQLLAVQVPLPSLAVQRRIAEHWLAMRRVFDAAKAELGAVVAELNDFLLGKYREEAKWDALEPSHMGFQLHTLQSWDVKAARAESYRDSVPTYTRLGDFLEDATVTVNPASEPEKEWPVYGVNNKDGVFFSHMQKGADFNASYKRIKEGWFFHNPTRAVVGSLGMVGAVPPDAITSPEYQVWRVAKGMLEGYVATLIATPYFQTLIRFHRMGAVKQRLYTENLFQIRVPELSVREQETFARRRKEALKRVADASGALEERALEVEDVIVGRRTIDEVLLGKPEKSVVTEGDLPEGFAPLLPEYS